MNKKLCIFKLIVIIVLMVSTLTLVACNNNGLIIKKITILPNNNDITSTGYSIALSSLVNEVVKLATSVPKSVDVEINDFANEADRLLIEYNINDQQYSSLRDDINANIISYSISIYNLYNGNMNFDYSHLKSFISFNLRVLGKDLFCDYIYDLVVYRLKYKYENINEGIFPAKYQEAKYNYDTFVQKISKKDFATVISNIIIIMDLITMNIEDEIYFSNSEIATLIKIPNCDTSIDEIGWTLLLKLIGNCVLNNKSYYGKLYKEIKDGNEINKFGEKMPLLINLISSVQNKIDENVVASLAGDLSETIFNIVPLLEDNDWELLKNVFDISVSKTWQVVYGEYENYTHNDYEDYEKYIEKHAHSVNDLKIATKENIKEILEVLIANINPAFSYGWRIKNDPNKEYKESI